MLMVFTVNLVKFKLVGPARFGQSLSLQLWRRPKQGEENNRHSYSEN